MAHAAEVVEAWSLPSSEAGETVVRPRTWWQKNEAHQSVVLNLVLWGVLLLVLLTIIYIERAYAF